MKYKLPFQIAELARQKTGLAIPINFVFGGDDLFPQYRDLGMTDGVDIILSRKMINLPLDNQVAVIAHEIAHLIMMQSGILHTENEADSLASWLIGKKIWYDEYDIQTTRNTGKIRPHYLGQ